MNRARGSAEGNFENRKQREGAPAIAIQTKEVCCKSCYRKKGLYWGNEKFFF